MREVPKSEARMAEARDYVAYFCCLDCYDKWSRQRPPEPQPPPEIQSGQKRSKSRDERLKRALRQHPRDEPKVDSVEPDETPG